MKPSEDEQTRPVAIVVDSAASLPDEVARDPRVHVAPMTLTLGGESYLDGRDVTPAEFYRLIAESPSPPTTSAPSPARFLEAFEHAAMEARAILCVTVAARFSASFDSAAIAAREASAALPAIEIRVLDSESAAGGQGLVALQAWRAAMRGASLEEAAAAAEDTIARVRLLAFPETLYYLWKSGRVPKIAHIGSALLRIKPVFELNRGSVVTVGRPRTRRHAMKRLVELMRERVESGPIHASVMHAGAEEAAAELRSAVEAEFACEELFVNEFTPAMGAHIGPGLVGVAFFSS